MDRRLTVVDSETTEKYMRIASISIALYDYIITLPAEWRLYRTQSSIFHLSVTCVLFILIRYVSIVVMIVSNFGVFSISFTQETCQQYYMVAPVFKVVQAMVSQVILGIRTFNIARRNRRVGIALVLLYFVSISLEWFFNMFHRIPVVDDGNCTPGNTGTPSVWLFYVAAMLYDLAVLTISTIHLVRYDTLSSRLERMVRVLMYDGIGYFIVLTGSNVLNIVLYRTSDVKTQAAGASIGYAVTWIMSQRILIHLREMSDTPHLENVVLARPAQSARNMMSALRSQNPKSPISSDFSPSHVRSKNDMELDIRVCVERSVVVDYMDDSEHSKSWGKTNLEAQRKL